MEKNCRSTHLELVGPIWTFTHTEKNYMDTGVELVGLTCTLTHTAKSYMNTDWEHVELAHSHSQSGNEKSCMDTWT